MQEIRIQVDTNLILQDDIHACIGYFDGIHKGHQALIEKAVAFAKEQGGKAALITFEPDPWCIIKHQTNIQHLTSMKQRKNIAEALGIQQWIILEFSQEMADLSVQDFHEKILFSLPLKNLVCGYDFHYAYRGTGNTETLQQQQRFHVEVVQPICFHDEKISSTRIEKLLDIGEIEMANALLTRPYAMEGTIVHGLKNGRKIGFPTANLLAKENYVCPKEGVYVGGVKLQDTFHPAMINVGKNPTFQGLTQTIEAHLLDFEGDLYGKEVVFFFYHYIREEICFPNIQALSAQLQEDVHASKQWFMLHKGECLCD